MIRLTREQMREASEAIDRFHQLANVARNTTDLEEHRRLWSEASEIQRQPSAKRPALRDGSIQLKVNLVAFLGNVVQA